MQRVLKPDTALKYCVQKAKRTLASIPAEGNNIPRVISSGDTAWQYVSYKDWTSGFWPGILWYVYEYTKDDTWKAAANKFTSELKPIAFNKAGDHDIGFQINTSFGNAYRLTGDTLYRQVMLAAADTLATLFNPVTGTILSWPGQVKHYGAHNTIIDNMMNLELLFWASKNGDGKKLYDIAVTHANTTMHNHFRPDYSAYHVILYDTVTGKKIKGVTAQGYSDASMWARGQSWAIYGFTMCYRETKDTTYLNFVQHVADKYLSELPEDMVPYWDFNAPNIPDAPRDASAAAITASALLELSTYVQDKTKAAMYRSKAAQMLEALGSSFKSNDANNAFLLHSTGSKPADSEVNASLIYGDYYYLEALLRLKKLQSGKNIFDPL